MRDLQCLHAAEGGVVIHQEIKAGRFQTPLPLFLAPEFRALRNRRFIGLFVKAAPMRVIQSIAIFLIALRAQDDEIADHIAWRERRPARPAEYSVGQASGSPCRYRRTPNYKQK